MKLNMLPKVTKRPKKRLGRGIGSGKGKTGGRGTKGQKARDVIPASFVGGSLPFYKKLPFMRGWGNKKANSKPVVIKLSALNKLKPKTIVNLETLMENNIISQAQAKQGVKILMSKEGELKNLLTVEIPVSKSVAKAIEKVGGKIAV